MNPSKYLMTAVAVFVLSACSGGSSNGIPFVGGGGSTTAAGGVSGGVDQGGGSQGGVAGGEVAGPAPIPQLAAAQSGSLGSPCESLASFVFDKTTIVTATTVAAGTLTVAGSPIDEHCRVTGKMNERVGPVDGQTYAIQFEMRLPRNWNGRFLHQGNGGIDGSVATATGGTGAGQTNALKLGFAVISSDAGHSAAQNPLFGMDPQARLDYGYAAVGTLTPMAKALIKLAYGRGPDRSYFAGGSNGGRHTMVAAARYAAEYDGFLAVSPGFNLPKSSIAQLWGAQQWATVATDLANLETALPVAERRLVADAILGRCDSLDGLADGMVNDYQGCRKAFDIQRDVPSCTGARDGTCLTAAQKSAFSNVYRGPINSAGVALYANWPFDPGMVASGWAGWKFRNSVGANRDPVSAVIFTTPPEPAKLADTLAYALNFSLDVDAPKFYATSGLYTESAISYMTPPNPDNLDTLRNRGAKMMIVHGEADGVFSPNDTAAYMDALGRRYSGDESNFIRFFRVPGMGHVSGGPATDQYAGLNILIDWVEAGRAPTSIVAQARGAGNPAGVNADVPATWAPNRSRPLCAYPLIAIYKGGDPESVASFACERLLTS